MELGREFKPSRKMMLLLMNYLLLIILPLYALGIALVLTLILVYAVYNAALTFALAYLLPLTIVVVFTSYWIPKYYASITYLFNENEVRVERGVWWKTHQAVPYSRIMNVEAIQGPISRSLGIGTVDIYTAGNTGQSGGRNGPALRRSDAAIVSIPNFLEVREQILALVRGRPLFAQQGVSTDNVGLQMLQELKEIRKLLGDPAKA